MSRVKFYDNEVELGTGSPAYETQFSIVDGDTFTIASEEVNPCCLNFASHKRPGGGYESVRYLRMPIRTQEEDLFRRSDLPEIMDQPEVRRFYPLEGREGLYCIANVYKDTKLDPVDRVFEVGIVTVPAVVKPRLPEQQPLVNGKLRRVFEIAADQKHQTLILGAWGCGVFGNNPYMVANGFMDLAMGDFKGVFEKVIFAVPNAASDNHLIFREVVGERT